MQGLHRPLTVETLPDPAPAAGELVVRVGRCGICGSDLHMTEDPAFGKGEGDVIGHEFAGEVVAVGSAAEGVAVGDMVSVVPIRGCGRCDQCLAGETAWCRNGMLLQGGGYAEYAVTTPGQCVVLPAGASMADGALVEPLAVALHGVRLSGLMPGDAVLVLGAGPIGLAVAFWARRMGASRVVVQDIADHQQERALAMGATGFVVDRADPVGAAVRALGRPADVVFECVGLPGLIAQAVDQVRVKGTVVILGLCTQTDSFVPFTALSKEVRLQTSAFFTRKDYEAALDVLNAGVAEPRAMITDTVALADVPTVFEGLKQRTHQCKVMIAPGA
ncbi:MAG: alcohol dehydrogenase catalytic domain-containing protein [Sphingomonas fennica]